MSETLLEQWRREDQTARDRIDGLEFIVLLRSKGMIDSEHALSLADAVTQNGLDKRVRDSNTNKQQPHTTNDLHTQHQPTQHPTNNEPSSRRSIR